MPDEFRNLFSEMHFKRMAHDEMSRQLLVSRPYSKHSGIVVLHPWHAPLQLHGVAIYTSSVNDS